MVDWDSRQYLRFERERTLPGLDLARRVELERVERAVDLGCGPGTSTRAIGERWPSARLTGVDSSPEMLASARASRIRAEWVLSDLRKFRPPAPVDLVFSNAALQWIPDHRHELPRLWTLVAESGALAFQVPAPGPERERWDAPLNALLRSPQWRDRIAVSSPAENVLTLADYYDLLAPLAEQVDLWDTVYVHVLASAHEVVEWLKGTALRPVFASLTDPAQRDRFVGQFARAISGAYPPTPQGSTLFPFRRRFVVAYRTAIVGSGSNPTAVVGPTSHERSSVVHRRLRAARPRPRPVAPRSGRGHPRAGRRRDLHRE